MCDSSAISQWIRHYNNTGHMPSFKRLNFNAVVIFPVIRKWWLMKWTIYKKKIARFDIEKSIKNNI